MKYAPSARLPNTVRAVRLRLGLSQREVATRMNVPRTFVSKIENGVCSPQLTTLERLALALDVGVHELLDPEVGRCDTTTRALMSDPFVAKIAAFVPRLGQKQMTAILATLRTMTMRRCA
jgi:transcriptional regulator with XRE-family HTH domain